MTKPKWISTKDKMPIPRILVAFWYNDEPHIGYFIQKSEYTEEYLWQSHIDSYNCISNVKYWFALPEGPESLCCPYCDPKFYVIYGYCGNCHKKCRAPLFDLHGNMSILDYEEYKRKWYERD